MPNPCNLWLVTALAVFPVVAQDGVTVRTELTKVTSKALEKTTIIPGELQPYQTVNIHARVTGFVDSIHVDRGSFVKTGQVLARMSAPELEAQRAEAQAKIPAVVAQRIEAEAQLAAAESTYERLAEAAKTPGVVAGNDVVLAEKAVEAGRARIESFDKTIAARGASVRAIEEIQKYLKITAPFAGVITARYAHVGHTRRSGRSRRTALVHPAADSEAAAGRRGTGIVQAEHRQRPEGSLHGPGLPRRDLHRVRCPSFLRC